MKSRPENLGDMDPEELRRWGHQAVDWVADYLSDVGDYPVVAPVAPGQIRSRLPAAPPARGEPMPRILEDLDTIVLPGLTHWNHPRFFAYFAITGSGPGIIGELVTAALNVNGMLWRTSPVATELEQVTLDWLRQLLGLPDGFAGVIMDTASMSTLVALASAREQAGLDVRVKGFPGRGEVPRLRIYASEEAHSSVEKAAITLGLGQQGVRKIATDDVYRMDPHALATAVVQDRAQGWQPLAVVATAGTTSTTSIDPLPIIADVCAEHGMWLHVDGAYGGMGAVVPELRWVLDGVERADSLVVNPHKWLFTPIDCSALYVRDPAALKRTFKLVPDYLRTEEEVEDYMHWGVQLGRRLRALKLWMVIRYFGQDGLAARIREHVRLARLAGDWVDARPRFERLAPTPLSTVCFRAIFAGVAAEEGDRRNAALLANVNATGQAYLSHTWIGARFALRLAVGNLRTTEHDVYSVLALLEEQAERLAEDALGR